MDEQMIERAAEAIYDFLDERFPDGAMPGGKQLFADDHLDAEFKHEAGCEELARAVIRAALAGPGGEALCERHGTPFISPGICPFCDEEARAAHSVMAGKVAELTAQNATLRRKLKELGCEEISNVDEHIAALAPYPERR